MYYPVTMGDQLAEADSDLNGQILPDEADGNS